MKVLASVLVALALCGFAVVSHAAAENVVHVKNPSPGEHVVVPCRDAKRIILDFDIKDTKCELSENNIVFHYDNGTIVTLEGILPSDGNLDKLEGVVLQIGQSEIYPPLRDMVMLMRGELIETHPGTSAKP